MYEDLISSPGSSSRMATSFMHLVPGLLGPRGNETMALGEQL